MSWHCRGPARTVVFGLLAALAWWPVATVLVPSWGPGPALVGHALAAVAVYSALLAGSRSDALRAGLLCAGLGAAGALLVPGARAGVVAAAVALAACRSGLVFRRAPARALVLEVLFIVAGLRLAAWAAGSAWGPPLGLWAFFLVQAAYFLVAGWTPRRRPGGDAFAAARRRVLAILEEPVYRS